MRCFTERGGIRNFFCWVERGEKGGGVLLYREKKGITILIRHYLVASYLEKFGKVLLKFFPFPSVFTTIVYDVDLDFSNIGQGIQSVVPLVNCIACIPGQSGDTVGF